MGYFNKAMLVASAALCFNLSTFAQDISLKINNVTVKEAMEQLKKASGYSFVFSSNDINTKQRVSVSVEDATIEEVVKQILKGQAGIDYEIQGKKIVLKKKSSSSTSQQKSGKVTGRVLDVKGEPIIGATVMEKGTNNGTITDFDGNFTINVSNGVPIEVSYIGFQSQEFKAIYGKNLAITLKEDAELLEEVVVVGFGTQKKADLTGAVSTVKVDEVLGNRPLTNLSSALQGTMPGLQITNGNAQPGSSPAINIRGVNSINGGSPLVLVDNMPMDINMVNPADIETVNVLKDASASSIYGAKAAFGVILITTKQGKKEEKVQLNYSGNFAFSKPNYLPVKASPLDDVIAYRDAGQMNDPNQGVDINTWIDYIKQYNENPNEFPDGYYMDEKGLIYYLSENDQFADMMDKFGFLQSHNISASGSSKTTNYRISLGMSNEDGVLISNKDTFRKYNISLFTSTQIVPWLKVETDLKYADTNRKWIEDGIEYGLWGKAIKNHSYAPLGGGYVDGIYYPLQTPRNAIEYGVPITAKNRNLRAMGRAVVSIIDGLTVTGEYAFLFETYQKNNFKNIIRWYWPPNNLGQNRTNNSYRIDNSSDVTHALNIFANYDKKIKNHSFNIMAGYNQEDYSYENSWISRQDIINEDIPSIGQATGEITAGDGFTQHSTRSLFYRINYSYNDRYLFGTSGRYDGSSKFPKNSRFGFFPSFSLGWRISEEKFMDWSDKYLSNMKVRFTYGEIGNQAIQEYAYIPGMDAYNSSWLVNDKYVTTLNVPALVSPSFTWETVRTSNYGFDLGMFNQKFNLSFDYYIRNTLDMLAPGMELPSVLGASAPMENTADLQTKGWELAVNWNDKIRDFGYHLGFNLYDSRTYITKYDNEVGLLDNYRVGQQLGEIWGFETDRLYAESDFDENGKVKEGIPVVEGVIPQPGDILYKDKNGDGIINVGENTVSNPGDRVIIGNNTMRFQYGINAGLSYKGFEISVFFQGVGKRDLWRSNDLVFPRYTEFSAIYEHQLDYWTPENTDAFYPRLYERSLGNTDANRKTQTRFLLDGAYCKLKNFTVSYTLPNKWYNKFNINRINVFFSGEDMWAHYNTPKGIDPEMEPVQEGWGYPNMRRMSLGINITL